MNVGAYSSLGAFPPALAQTSTAVTTSTPGTTIWTVGTFSPLLANAVTAPSAYRCEASGTINFDHVANLPGSSVDRFGYGQQRADD